ncbi:hypothetical protein ACQEU8_09020 [Streptomyces sp. CA-250714]
MDVQQWNDFCLVGNDFRLATAHEGDTGAMSGAHAAVRTRTRGLRS